MTKLYGLTVTLHFLCICYGAKAFFLSINKTPKGLKCYHGNITSENVLRNAKCTYPWWFFGFMIVDSNKGFLNYEEYYEQIED